MKKLKNIILLLALIVILPITVNASSASINVKTSGQAVVGNTISATVSVNGSNVGAWQFLISYDSSKLQLVSGQASQADTYKTNPSKSYTLKFKVLKSGSASINVGSYLVYDMDDSQMSVSVGNATVKTMTQAELEATYSKNNNLKNISVDDYELSPEFNKDTLEYTVKVPSTVDSVEISATKEDSTASVDGTGSKEVVEGSNNFEIVVTAQNGSTKTYKVNVIVEDINPIELSIDGIDYTVVKREDNLETPKGFESTTVEINEMEIPAFKSDLLNLVVVGIKDSEGNIKYAIYDNGKYELYKDITSNNITIYLTKIKKEFKNYIKTTIEINGNEVECYKLNEKSEFAIIYGKNVETGNEDYYVYDIKEKTFQRYNEEEIKDLEKTLKTYTYVIIAFGGALILLFLILIISLISKKKGKKAIMLDNNKQELYEEIENGSKKKNNDLFEKL